MVRLRAGGASAVAVGLVLVVVPPAPAQDDVGCPQPWAPVYVQRGIPWDDPPPDLEVSWVTESLDPGSWDGWTDDLDGDGSDDIRVVDDRVRVKRPGGDLVVTVPGTRLAAVGLADLDGDGGHEIGVVRYADGAPGSGIASGTWLVPWDAPAGEFDPAAVGVALPDGWPYALDDRDGDGVEDLLLVSHLLRVGAGTTTLQSGAAALAGGAPADLSASTGLWQLPGKPGSIGDLGGPVPAILLLDHPVAPDPLLPSPFTVRVVEEDLIATLRGDTGEQVAGADLAWAGTGPDGRFVGAGSSGRPGGTTWYWSLDDPCRQLEPPPAPPMPEPAPPGPPPAPPASPTGGTPGYTG